MQPGGYILEPGKLYKFDKTMCATFATYMFDFLNWSIVSDTKENLYKGYKRFSVNEDVALLFIGIEVEKITKSFEQDYLIFLFDNQKWALKATNSLYFTELSTEE